MKTSYIIWIFLTIILIYCSIKELRTYGCSTPTQLITGCDETEGSVLSETQPESGMTDEQLWKLLEKNISLYDTIIIWRKAYIFSFLLTIIFYYSVTSISSSNTFPDYFIIYTITIFTFLLYFWFNHVNYHYLKPAELNALNIIKRLKK